MNLLLKANNFLTRQIPVKCIRSKLEAPVASFTFDDFPRSAWTIGGPILAKYGAEVIDRMQLYAVWFAFDFAFNHDDATVYAWCVNQIRGHAD